MVVPVEEVCSVVERVVDAAVVEGLPERLSPLNRENVQAKVRATDVLSNLAAKFGGLFVCCGNKLEIALGYATLYGDVGGAIAPLGDLTKVEVYEMGRFLNERVFGRQVIPAELFPDDLFRCAPRGIPPSAELAEGQVDPMKFGYHDALLGAFTDFLKKTPADVLHWYLEGVLGERLGVTTALLERWGLDDPAEFVSDLEWFCQSFQTNVFKRVQAPPVVVTSKTAFGFDLREAQLPFWPSREFQRLKERVLALERYVPFRGR
ncbi:MAG: hypothetical protein Kow0069_16590 [Promethearchaeota archaeon]